MRKKILPGDVVIPQICDEWFSTPIVCLGPNLVEVNTGIDVYLTHRDEKCLVVLVDEEILNFSRAWNIVIVQDGTMVAFDTRVPLHVL